MQVVAATNRIDILDPALLRSGRLDRKIEFPHPTEEARARILQIHSRKMNVSDNVNYEELARCTDDFNGAQLKVRGYSHAALICGMKDGCICVPSFDAHVHISCVLAVTSYGPQLTMDRCNLFVLAGCGSGSWHAGAAEGGH